MGILELKSNYPCAYACVPNIFIESYMADANGEFVKVYLYLLRAMSTGTELSVSAIADALNHTEKDVMRALKYWEKVGVLSLETDDKKKLVGLCLLELRQANNANIPVTAATAYAPVPPAPVAAIPTAVANAESISSATATAKPVTPARREYTLDELSAFSNNAELTELLYIVEQFLKHPLNSTEMNTLFFWYDSLHFSGELIEYLVEYCITTGHSSLRYMDKVAMGWAESGIDSIDKAKEQIALRSKAYYSIMKAFGISGRNLAESEMNFVNKWTKEYKFDTEIIQEACKRTISATQKPSFEYADKILANWFKNQVHGLQDISALDTSFTQNKRGTGTNSSGTSPKRNKFNNFDQRQYDGDALEKMLLTTSV